MKPATNLLRQLSLCALAVLSLGTQATVISSTGSALSIPDNKSTGVSSTISLSDVGTLSGLSVTVALNHKNLGDLTATLSHGGKTTTLLKRVEKGESKSDLSATYPLTFSASAKSSASKIGAQCEDNDLIGSKNCKATQFQPQDAFTTFFDTSATGDWVLTITDLAKGTTGSLISWSMAVDTEPQPPAPVAAPAPLTENLVHNIPEPDSLAIIGLALVALGIASGGQRRRSP